MDNTLFRNSEYACKIITKVGAFFHVKINNPTHRLFRTTARLFYNYTSPKLTESLFFSTFCTWYCFEFEYTFCQIQVLKTLFLKFVVLIPDICLTASPSPHSPLINSVFLLCQSTFNSFPLHHLPVFSVINSSFSIFFSSRSNTCRSRSSSSICSIMISGLSYSFCS